ncbi:MAG: ATP-binding protein [Aquabacterium sp.]
MNDAVDATASEAEPGGDARRLASELAAAQARITELEATVRQQAEREAAHQLTVQRLRERDALLHSLGQNIPGVLYKVVFPKDGSEPQVKYINEHVIEFYEYDPGQTHSWNSHFTRIHPDDIDKVKAITQLAATERHKLVRYEYRMLLPSKGLRWAAGQSIAIREDNGDVAWYGYTADVTEQKLYADAVIAARAADHANQAKSEFLSRMSHELRTPLNAVLGFAQLLRMDRGQVFGEEQRHRVRLIEKAGQHLLSMLGDVMDLSRIEAGSLPLSIETVDLPSVCEEAVSMVQGLAQASRIQIDTRGVTAGLRAQADRVRIRQILVNLLSNGIKYNRQGGQVILRTWADAEHRVHIDVEDTGIGMSDEQQAHLFEPFNRLGVERSGIEGTGIGLVIVRRLVSLMNGELSLRSESGRGSRFHVALPASDDEAPVSDVMTLDEADSGERPATILYAEDNEVNVALVHQIVKLRPHWRLLVATNGERALQLARRSLPDLMLIDIHLGDMTGFDLANELDRDLTTSRIPRVALSADAMPDRIQAAKAAGFKAYLTKPLDVMALLRCLDENLSSRPAFRESGWLPAES